MEPIAILILVVFGGLILVSALFAYQSAQKRRLALVALANRLGWSFQPANDRSLVRRYAGLKSLEKGSNRYAYNVLAGTYRGRAACAFDYHYETHTTDSKGKRSTHHHHCAVVVVETGLPLKPLVIRPEGFFDRVAEFFGMDDIDFESNEFSRAFHVTSPDRRWAFDVIHQETMEYLLAAPRYHLQFFGPRVVLFRESCFSAAEIESALQVASGLIDRLPKYLLREWKGAV